MTCSLPFDAPVVDIIDERLMSSDTARDVPGVTIQCSDEAMKVQVNDDGDEEEKHGNDKENDHNDGLQQSHPAECSKSTRRSRSAVFKVADKLRRRVLRMVSGTNTRYVQK